MNAADICKALGNEPSTSKPEPVTPADKEPHKMKGITTTPAHIAKNSELMALSTGLEPEGNMPKENGGPGAAQLGVQHLPSILSARSDPLH